MFHRHCRNKIVTLSLLVDITVFERLPKLTELRQVAAVAGPSQISLLERIHNIE